MICFTVQNNFKNTDLTVYVFLLIFSTRFIKKKLTFSKSQHSQNVNVQTQKRKIVISFCSGLWMFFQDIKLHCYRKLNSAGYIFGPCNSSIDTVKLWSGTWHEFGLHWLIFHSVLPLSVLRCDLGVITGKDLCLTNSSKLSPSTLALRVRDFKLTDMAFSELERLLRHA